MKGFVSIGVAVFLLLTAAFPARSHSNQLSLGTQLHLVLLNGLTTPVARDADPFCRSGNRTGVPRRVADPPRGRMYTARSSA